MSSNEHRYEPRDPNVDRALTPADLQVLDAFARARTSMSLPHALTVARTIRRKHQSTGHLRNGPCVCGSGKKWKKCCGRSQ